ncbi:MAG: helix-turn-helix domain-containing protein [Moheibacter sp.]
MNNLRDDEFLRKFGLHIKSVRESKDYTQEKLALEMGVEISQISRIERGKINSSICTIKAIANSLNIPLKDLLDFEIEVK